VAAAATVFPRIGACSWCPNPVQGEAYDQAYQKMSTAKGSAMEARYKAFQETDKGSMTLLLLRTSFRHFWTSKKAIKEHQRTARAKIPRFWQAGQGVRRHINGLGRQRVPDGAWAEGDLGPAKSGGVEMTAGGNLCDRQQDSVLKILRRFRNMLR